MGKKFIAALTSLAAATAGAVSGFGVAGAAAPTELYISEYIEGSSNNKALELYNGTGATIDLGVGGYSVQMFFNGSSTAGLTISLTGTVAVGDVYVIANASAATAVLAQADLTNGAGWYNGDDAIVLRKSGVAIDSIGQVGTDPGTEWGTGLQSTADNTLRRKASVCGGDPDSTDVFDPSASWDGFATDTFADLGTHTAACDGGGGGGGGGTSPCTETTVSPAAIQGAGAAAAITGAVKTRGVVVGDFEVPGGSGQLRGFYVQDPIGDGDSATSDAVFVFTGSGVSQVAVGDEVRVDGTAAEFQGQTQVSATAITVCGTGTVTPAAVSLPLPDATFLERYEGMVVSFAQKLTVTEHFQLGRFGQVVVSSGGRLPQPTSIAAPGAAAAAVQAAYDLNRLIVDDATNVQNPDPIIFGRNGSPLSATNTLRGGDTVTGMVGVLTYTWAGNAASGNAYRVRPVGALGGAASFVAENTRPAWAPPRQGSVRVTGMNLLNFFNTFDGRPDTVDNCRLGVGGAPTDCRGADDLAEFDRQWPKTVQAIVGSDADVVGVVEIENDGYGATSALATLVDKLNAATAAGTYRSVDVDAGTGVTNALGTDAIKVGVLYRPAVVTPVGTTATLNTTTFVNAGDGSPRNRPALAQAFEENATGARFIAVVNHLKSKGSACDAPDTGDGQGNCSAVRAIASQALTAWLATDPTGVGDRDVLLVGDYNAYAKEAAITTIEAAGYTNLIAASNGPSAYSYVFDGQWGYLDHALASSSLAGQVRGVTEWHINADEPSVLDYNTDFKSAGQQSSLYAADQFRTSDHDPVLVDLALTVPYTFGGFAEPLTAPGATDLNAGRALPVTFSLGGVEGEAVVATSLLRWVVTDCTSGAVLSTQPVELAGSGRVGFDGVTGRYSLLIKSDKAWAGRCQTLEIVLTDGTDTMVRRLPLIFRPAS